MIFVHEISFPCNERVIVMGPPEKNADGKFAVLFDSLKMASLPMFTSGATATIIALPSSFLTRKFKCERTDIMRAMFSFPR